MFNWHLFYIELVLAASDLFKINSSFGTVKLNVGIVVRNL